ncbi:MAG: hypothetical protein RBU37_08760 [Myxococcota bacterium]|nr:hypothetical protein [Myxococcota bacterium]
MSSDPQPGMGARLRLWSSMAALALLFHIPALYAIAAIPEPRATVRVSSMSHAPEQRHLRKAEERLNVSLELDAAIVAPRMGALGAVLEYQGVACDGRARPLAELRTWPLRSLGDSFEAVAWAELQDASRGKLSFSAPWREGRYRVRLLASGPFALLGGREALDGEYRGVLPSGDGVAGGDFEAVFELCEQPETMTAKLVRQPPPKPPEPQPLPEQPEASEPAEAELSPEVKQPRAANPRPSLREDSVHEPVPRLYMEEELVPSAPQEAKLEELFELSPWELEQIYGEKAERMIKQLAQERERAGLFGGWEEDWAKVKGSFEGQGPRVKAGQSKAVALHRKEVWQYIALMHKRIHPQWAETYLLNLDLLAGSVTNPLSNPDLRTVLEIRVSEQGAIDDVQIVSTSGIAEYDAEAIHVAWNSGPGEVVPEAMLSDDGFVYLHWSFWRDQRQCGTFGVQVYVLANGERKELGFDLEAVHAEEQRLGIHQHDAAMPPGPVSVPAPSPAPSSTSPELRPASEERDSEPKVQRRKRGRGAVSEGASSGDQGDSGHESP